MNATNETYSYADLLCDLKRLDVSQLQQPVHVFISATGQLEAVNQLDQVFVCDPQGDLQGEVADNAWVLGA